MTTLSAMVERKSTRVFGVGVGVFLIGFFFVLSLLICCLGSLTARPRLYYRRALTILGVVLIYLFAAQKQTQFVTQEETLQEYNDMYDVRIGVGVFLILSAFFALRTTLHQVLFDKVETETFDEEVPTRRMFF